MLIYVTDVESMTKSPARLDAPLAFFIKDVEVV